MTFSTTITFQHWQQKRSKCKTATGFNLAKRVPLVHNSSYFKTNPFKHSGWAVSAYDVPGIMGKAPEGEEQGRGSASATHCPHEHGKFFTVTAPGCCL